MNRKDLINLVKFAGYHNDTEEGTRLLCEHRISLQAYNEAFRLGIQARKNGIKCNCKQCNPDYKNQSKNFIENDLTA